MKIHLLNLEINNLNNYLTMLKKQLISLINQVLENKINNQDQQDMFLILWNNLNGFKNVVLDLENN